MTRHRRRAAGDRGAVAVEFALILPVLLLIVVGTIEFGRVYSQVQVYNGSAREGARCAAVMAQSFATCRSLGDVQQTHQRRLRPVRGPASRRHHDGWGRRDRLHGLDDRSDRQRFLEPTAPSRYPVLGQRHRDPHDQSELPMRVNPMWRMLRRTHRDESGAVLMVVAVTLLVLIGMLVLTVDLGRAVAVKREMVSGTDAAVIAAAHECALGHSYGQATAAANAILAQNKSGAVLNGPISAPGCGVTPTEPQLVTVHTKVPIDYFFAGIFGFNSGEVGADAVAEWGVVAGGLGVPVTVDLQQLMNCGITPDPPSPAEVDGCQLDYPKDTLQEPRWGVLDLDQVGRPGRGALLGAGERLDRPHQQRRRLRPAAGARVRLHRQRVVGLGVGIAGGAAPALPGVGPGPVRGHGQAEQRRRSAAPTAPARTSTRSERRATTARSTRRTSWGGSSCSSRTCPSTVRTSP